jgi:GNAT superfamily N-acetyltransferase
VIGQGRLLSVTAANITVRPAATADRSRMADVLAAAFADDPVFRHLLPPGIRRRAQRIRRLFDLDLPRGIRSGGGWISADGDGAAMWFPPGQWETPSWQGLLHVPASIATLGSRLPIGVRTMALLQAHHPREPHWYLLFLGTEPARQGRGIGSALLRPMLDTCDAQHLPAYLEATCERNRDLYLRHGFVDHGEPLRLPDDGPPMYPMWREPR